MSTINLPRAVPVTNGNTFSVSRIVALSAANLLNAGILANDREAAITEARRLYRNGSRWSRVQSQARRELLAAERAGLSLSKPYAITKDSGHAYLVALVCGGVNVAKCWKIN